MINSYVVSRDDSIYEAFPDIARMPDGTLIVVFLECTHHGKRTNVRIAMAKSRDDGKTWERKTAFTPRCDDAFTYNCPRINLLPDGTVVVNCDIVQRPEGGKERDIKLTEQHVWRSHDGGKSFVGPERYRLHGIVPDKYRVLENGRHTMGVHAHGESGNLEQFLCTSDDGGKTWVRRQVAADPRYNLCEGCLLELGGGELVMFMRENSGMGYDCKKAISHDYGDTWEGVYDTNIDACHRPVVGFADADTLLMTYRFMQGGNGWLGTWTQNLFAAFFDRRGALAKTRREMGCRILPLAFDRSPVSDTGYSGWVRLPDGTFYVVNYIVDDAPKAYIRGYTFRMEDVLVPLPRETE